ATLSRPSSTASITTRSAPRRQCSVPSESSRLRESCPADGAKPRVSGGWSLGTSPDADLLAHLFGLLLGSALGLVAAAARPRSLPPLAQGALAGAVLALVIGAWLRALS